MAADQLTREQRLRLQAELQSLYGTLANLRERETSYMSATATVPMMFGNQVDDVRRQIADREHQLYAGETATTPEARGRQIYSEAFNAEQAGELTRAIKLYKSASRYSHPDAYPALRSARYRQKAARATDTPPWAAAAGRGQTRNRIVMALAVMVILLAIIAFVVIGLNVGSSQTVAAEVTVTATLVQTVVQFVVPDTPTPLPTSTATPTLLPTFTSSPPQPTATTQPQPPTDTPTPAATRTPAPTLRPAPKIIGPRDGLVWLDGAVVFEFEPQDLAYDELYCLNTMRGYDYTATENWSYDPVGSKQPRIVVDANVFRVAQVQGMQCVKWSLSIGKGSCENQVSRPTVDRVIGLPRPCDF
ncbi:MAG: hypothetical protein FOGNACKC_00440 [Anaerolineae bacterium]|nr:hypothetical protein [Anaerolineae bacterium]